jgi:hypothetical protein
MLLEQNITKHWRWDLRAKKLNFCADGDVDVYGSPDLFFYKINKLDGSYNFAI